MQATTIWPLGKLLLQVQDEELRIVLGNAEIRHKGDAQADSGQVDEQIVAGELDFRHQVQLVFLEHLVKEFAGGALAVQASGWGAPGAPAGSPCARLGESSGRWPRRRRRNSRRVRMLLALREAGVGVVGEDKIHLPVLQHFRAGDGGLIGHLDVDVGVPGVEFLEEGHQVVAARWCRWPRCAAAPRAGCWPPAADFPPGGSGSWPAQCC